jgi:Bacterial extracellular solute-binding proteins, family 5 Middle
MLGLDRQRIIDTVYGRLAGNLKPLDNMLFFSTQPRYRPDFRRWNYNPAKALALLKKHCAAGSGPAAPSPANTKIWQCSGLPATFNWTWNVNNETWGASEQIAKAELKSIGIQINEKPLPSSGIFGPNGIPSGDYDITQFAWVGSGDPGDFYGIYRCGGGKQLHRLLQPRGRRTAEGRERRARAGQAGVAVPAGRRDHGHSGADGADVAAARPADPQNRPARIAREPERQPCLEHRGLALAWVVRIG